MGKVTKAVKAALDMSSKARMARAREQGFAPIHNRDDFLYRKKTKLEISDDARELGFDSVDDYVNSMLDNYPGGKEGLGAVGIRAMNSPQEFNPSVVGGVDYSVGARVDNSFNTFDDEVPVELGGASSIGVDYEDITEEVEGFDSFIDATETYSHGAPRVVVGGSRGMGGADHGEVVIENPHILGYLDDIRSVNAAFDPAKSKSANLLASAAPVAVGLSALYTPEESAAQAAPYIGAEESLRYGGRPDTIQPEEHPMLEGAADFMRKYDQTPIGPMFEGTQNYLRNFGRERSNMDKLYDYLGVAGDVL